MIYIKIHLDFQALLHAPNTLPEMVEYGFAIDPGKEMFLSVSPEMIHADNKIHGIQYTKRQCFLANEKSLEYYQHYTFLNCFMECASNYTFNVKLILTSSFKL